MKVFVERGVILSLPVDKSKAGIQISIMAVSTKIFLENPI